MSEHDGRAALAKYDYYKGPTSLADEWTLSRAELILRCTLATHRLGWELKLAAGKNVSRTRVCRSEKEVFETAAAWRAEAEGQGWKSTDQV